MAAPPIRFKLSEVESDNKRRSVKGTSGIMFGYKRRYFQATRKSLAVVRLRELYRLRTTKGNKLHISRGYVNKKDKLSRSKNLPLRIVF